MRLQSILACATAAPLLLGAAEPVRLAPTTKWVLEYADENCRLARKFGAGPQQVTLVLDQFEPGDEFRMILIGEPTKPRSADNVTSGRLRFGPNEEETDFEAETGTVGEQRALILLKAQRLAALTRAEEKAADLAKRRNQRFEAAPIGPVREAGATWLEVRKGLVRPLILETGSMREPMEALRTCSWDTVRHWGLDIAQQKGLTRKPHPKTPSGSWFVSGDYPAKMARAGFHGVVHFRLLVDANGVPTTCRVQRSTQPKEFDDVTCATVMRNARFDPALDAQGKPVSSYWIATVRFQLADPARR